MGDDFFILIPEKVFYALKYPLHNFKVRFVLKHVAILA